MARCEWVVPASTKYYVWRCRFVPASPDLLCSRLVCQAAAWLGDGRPAWCLTVRRTAADSCKEGKRVGRRSWMRGRSRGKIGPVLLRIRTDRNRTMETISKTGEKV